MKLLVNGVEREFSSAKTVSDLIEQLALKPDRVAVELNRAIVPRGAWSETTVNDGDRIEIVQFVGGGSPA